MNLTLQLDLYLTMANHINMNTITFRSIYHLPLAKIMCHITIDQDHKKKPLTLLDKAYPLESVLKTDLLNKLNK